MIIVQNVRYYHPYRPQNVNENASATRAMIKCNTRKDKVVIFGVSFLVAIWNVTTAAVMVVIVAMLVTLIFGYKHVC